MSTDSNTTMPALPEPMYLGCDPNAGPVYAFTGSHMREYAQSYAEARVQALRREVEDLRADKARLNTNSAPSTDDARRMGETGGAATEAERLAFEAWMAGHCWALSAEWTGSQYLGSGEVGGNVCPRAMRTRQLWAAWRDRAALASKAEVAKDGLVPVGLICERVALRRLLDDVDSLPLHAHKRKVVREWIESAMASIKAEVPNG